MKKILICLSLIYFENILACSPLNQSEGLFESKALAVDPERAMVAFTGLIEIGKNILQNNLEFIVPERKWTIVQEKKIQTSSICELAHMTGERYLFLSNSKDMKNDRFLIELENAGEYISKLARRKNFIGNINPAWQYCKKDEECTIVKDECKSDISVNLEYKNIYLNFLKTRYNTKCSSESTKQKPKNKCVNYFCS